MVVIDTRSNTCHARMSRSAVAILVGVHRQTVLTWEKKRTDDGSNVEIYNHFRIYFKVINHKQKKGDKHRRPPEPPPTQTPPVFRRP